MRCPDYCIKFVLTKHFYVKKKIFKIVTAMLLEKASTGAILAIVRNIETMFIKAHAEVTVKDWLDVNRY